MAEFTTTNLCITTKPLNLKNNFKYIPFLFLVFIILNSCSPTKYISGNEKIVDDVEIKVLGSENISTSKMKKIAQPAPLKKIVGIYAFRARVYNIIDPDKEDERKEKKEEKKKKKKDKKIKKISKNSTKLLNKRNTYLNKKNDLYAKGDTINAKIAEQKYLEYNKEYEYQKTILTDIRNNYNKDVFTFADFILKNGQKPEEYNTVLINYTKRQFKVYLQNQGYFNAEIKDSVTDARFGKNRVKVIYIVDPGEPLRIGSVTYNFPASTDIEKYFLSDTSLRFKTGNKIDINELEKFRTNLAQFYRNHGYYFFTKQLISFQIDTTNGKYENANLIINFNENVNVNKIYQPWTIRKINVFNDYYPSLALQDPNYLFDVKTDTFVDQDEKHSFIMQYKFKEVIKPKHIAKEIYLFPDSLYNLKSTKTTYSHLSKFKIYKITNIQFTEIDTTHQLDCDIRLTPDKTTDLTFDIVATRNSINLGGAANSTFSHRNLFRGGEILDVMFELALERQKTNDTINSERFFNTQEYNFDLKITVPRLLLPFKSNNFIKRNNPKTIISTLFSYQNRPEYNRTQAILRMDYFLKSSDYSNHIITIPRISSIKAELTPEFEDWVQRAMLQESYEDHFIISLLNYSYIYTNQGAKGNNFYFQSNTGFSGNLVYALSKMFDAPTVDGTYILPVVESQFAQFIKSDFEYRYFFKGDDNQLATRFFIGAGLPLGNSKLLPFGEKYFVGGANSIRAWQARTLGPGQYVQSGDYLYTNQTADIRLELNLEYRFKIFGFLEGVTFLDVGNIWNINTYDSREGGTFYINTFYKQLAYGTGIGARINLDFFVFRTDVGLKLFDPALPINNRFAFNNIAGKSFIEAAGYLTTLNIAIGYPF